MTKLNKPEARVALECLFNRYYFYFYFSTWKPNYQPIGGCDQAF